MTDAYKIGITVALTNLIGSELTQIAKQFGVAEKSAAGFGVALGVAGVAMAALTAALVAGVNEARKFQVETAKFALFGMGDKVNRDAQALRREYESGGHECHRGHASHGRGAGRVSGIRTFRRPGATRREDVGSAAGEDRFYRQSPGWRECIENAYLGAGNAALHRYAGRP